MEKIKKLLLENKAWAKNKVEMDPEFFSKMAKEQHPDYLFIGCVDSRVHPAEMTNIAPGQMLVHRNIANLVVHTDTNLMSVLHFAVEILKVSHIMVCGHYNCGGVKAAVSNQSLGMIDDWVRNIKDVYFQYKEDMDSIADKEDRLNRLVELSVQKQVLNIAHTAVIQKSWKERKYPHIHGWVYDINVGILEEIATVGPDTDISDVYKYTI